jgi:hypothetical protein
MAAEERSIHQEIAALREGQAALREGQEHIVSQLELTRRELREDLRDVRAHVVAVQNGQLAFATATVAGLLGVTATLIVKL